MKMRINFSKEKGTFILPVVAIGYDYENKELAFVFMFACWAFSIELNFK